MIDIAENFLIEGKTPFLPENSLQENQETRKALLLKYHPDKPGGSLSKTQVINLLWDCYTAPEKNEIPSHDFLKKAWAGQVYDEKKDEFTNIHLDKFINSVPSLEKLYGIRFSLIGCWCWVEGTNSSDDHELLRGILMSLGFAFSSKNKKWCRDCSLEPDEKFVIKSYGKGLSWEGKKRKYGYSHLNQERSLA